MGRRIREIPWLDTRNGVWCVCRYDKEARRTHRHSLRTSDAAEAQIAFAKFLTDGKVIFEKAGQHLLVKDAVDSYIQEHVERATVARARNRQCAEEIRTLLGHYELRAIDVRVCGEYIDKRRKKVGRMGRRISDATITRELGILRAAAGHALKMKRITLAEMPTISKPPVTPPKVGFYSKEELRFILGTAEDDLKDFMTVLYYTGARRNVIEQLEESQVNFDTGVIYQAKPGERQTKKRRPPIPLDGPVREILLRRKGKGKYFGKNMYDRYRKHLQGMGFDDRANPHVMRHTRATLMLMDGVSIYQVARRLGDTVATVERIYAHAIVQDMADVGGEL